MAKVITSSKVSGNNRENWVVPDITWINGDPSCRITTWAVKHFTMRRDIVITITHEAARDLREKLASRLGADAISKVRTMASVLVNGFRGPKSCDRLIVDEALMSHFGAIDMVTRLESVKEILLIGDVNQLLFIDRLNLFEMEYIQPNLMAKVTKKLLCTYRNPIDVAYAFNEVEKESLIVQGFEKGEGTRVLTIHEEQGLTPERTVIVRTTVKLKLHDCISRSMVAITHHTASCSYYADDGEDAVSRFIKRALAASDRRI
ncbi:hypothetical protein EVAR_14146_1 [Eumeta japonica]|uniref:(+)RNA virus helicase C-terminal domain-containing protein n=1 Tax=Eumeta variegata TaxID=151549 RepID=A0A4C1UEA4_EUMVA|nr:hypothetical protein EVAR_14146_1 [Eumeta japonica]